MLKISCVVSEHFILFVLHFKCYGYCNMIFPVYIYFNLGDLTCRVPSVLL